MHFFSFGFYHHDICLVKHHKLKMDNNSMLHFTLMARDRDAFDAIRKSAAAMEISVRDGRLIASAMTSPGQRSYCLQDPDRHWMKSSRSNAHDRSFLRSSQVLPPLLQKFASLLKRKWFRELVLAPPTITRRRFSNKTEDYGVFKPSRIAQIGQLSIYVQDIERSRQWYRL